MIGLVEIDLGQECGSGSLRGASLLHLGYRQMIVSVFQVVDNLLPTLIVRVLCIRDLLDVIVCQAEFIDKRNLLEQTLQLEVSIGTEELHLGDALLNISITLICCAQYIETEVDT